MAFKKAVNEAAFLKAGFFGENGSGKTWTACDVAIGLHKFIKSKKPVGFVDSETGSDYQVRRFKEAGVELEVDKTRTFSTLKDDMQSSIKLFDILVVDSITHFWQELMKAYKERYKLRFLRIYDFGPLKDEWNHGFTSAYVNSPLHIIICGRAAEIYQDIEQDEDGKSEWKTVSVGSRMSAEKNLAYEPSLLIEMDKELLRDGGRYDITATVVKERFDQIMGKTFTNPRFKDFLPHIKCLNLGGEHVGFDEKTSSASMFSSSDTSTLQRNKQVAILLEELTALRDKWIPGASPKDRQAKTWIAQEAFGTSSLKKIEDMKPAEIRAGIGLCEYFMKRYVEEEVVIEGEAGWKAWLGMNRTAYEDLNRPGDFGGDGAASPENTIDDREFFAAIEANSLDVDDVNSFIAESFDGKQVDDLTAEQLAQVTYAINEGLVLKWIEDRALPEA